jgi:hypothetical protein
MDYRPDWVLISPGGAGELRELAPWLRDLVSSRRALIDDFVELPGVACASYVAAIEPYYLTARLVLAAFFEPGNRYTLVILEQHNTDVVHQPQLVRDSCIAAVRMPLTGSPASEQDLHLVLGTAFQVLRGQGVLSGGAT